jgi:hypothetical protein
MPEKRQPTLEPLDEEVDHVRGMHGVVHRGGYDAATLMEALAR